MNKKDFLQSVLYFLWKFSSFMLAIFIITDIAILIRILLKNYGEPITWPNIYKTLWVFIPLTIIFYITKRISKLYWDRL